MSDDAPIKSEPSAGKPKRIYKYFSLGVVGAIVFFVVLAWLLLLGWLLARAFTFVFGALL